ncbi:unnamed protein product [Adineta ricciae]|uniref:Glycosyl hydrolase family 13 catalytic domain-containing protein n=1 Tax=Adineta ricciae TaxID=249248 RepID=A0A814DEK1_ADIRI|nr:unnamed protein product [Adineta ricciae]
MLSILGKTRTSSNVVSSLFVNSYCISTVYNNARSQSSNHSSKPDNKIPSSKTLSLFAPTVDEVNLVSSFSQWKPISLKKDVETGVFQMPPSPHIDDGEHEYKFSIRKHAKQKYWTSVIDPYAEKYDAKHHCGLITFKDGKKYVEPYEWKHDHIKLPENDQLIIYELYVADFTDNGQFSGVLSKLNYLTDLGINAIELMPIHDYMGNEHNWGYSPTHHFALKATYGTKNDLKKLVDECHGRGIRVFLDGVFNHSSLACPLVLIDKNYWYYKDKHHPEDPYHWGAEFNYDYYDEALKLKPAVKYAQDVVRYWIGEFHFDGIRFDAAKQMDNYDVLRELDRVARSVRPNQPFFSQAEYVPEQGNIVKANNGPVDACWSSTFHGVVCNALVDQTKFELDLLKYVISAPNLVNYLTCHDNERLMYLIGHLGKAFNDNAFQRARLGAIVLMTSISTPMIWQGDEFGEARQLGSPNQHRKIIPMQWSLLGEEPNKSLHRTFKRLIEFRRTILNQKNYTKVKFIYENAEQRILAYTRSSDETDADIVIVLNLSDQLKRDIEIVHRHSNGHWVDWLTSENYSVKNSTFKLNLKPFDGKVLLKHH